MGYFDGMTAASFKKDADGQELFFFWGKFGKGRMIPTPEDAASARRYLKNFYIGLMLGIVPMVLIAGHGLSTRWIVTVLAFMGIAFLALVPLWLRIRAWPLSDERITIKESMTASAKGHGLVSLSILIVGALIMIAGSLSLFFAGMTVIGLIGTVFFGFCLVVFLFMLRARKQA